MILLCLCLLPACREQEAPSVLGALHKQEAGDHFTARQDYLSLMPEVKGGELEPFVRYNIARCEAKLKMLHEALEGFLGIAQDHPKSNYALLALEQAAAIYKADNNSKKVDQCYVRALKLYQQHGKMRRIAGQLLDVRTSEMKSLLKAKQGHEGIKLLARTKKDVPKFLLDAKKLAQLKKLSQVQVKRNRVNTAKTYQLEVGKMASVKRISDDEFPSYKGEKGYLIYSPDKSKYVFREMAKDGFYYLHLGAKGQKRKKLSKTRGALYPVWDKDGKRIIFTRRNKASGDNRIEALTLANNRLRQLYVVGEELGYRVTCSPTSGKISFVYNGDIWLMEGTGMDVRKLTDGLKLVRSAHLGWSVDGSRIFYSFKGSGGKGSGPAKLGVVHLESAG